MTTTELSDYQPPADEAPSDHRRAVDVALTDIHIGPRRRERESDTHALMDSIRSDGLRLPVLLAEDRALISGYRRLMAHQKLGAHVVPAVFVADLDQAAVLLRKEREDRETQFQEPMNAIELVAFVERAAMLKRTYAMRTLRDATPVLAGMSYPQYNRVREIVVAARAEEADGERPSHDALDRLNAVLSGAQRVGENGKPLTVKGIYNDWWAPRRDAARIAPTGRRVPPRGQRVALASGFAGLNGLISGLATVDCLAPEISAAEAERWMSAISNAQRVLRTLNTKLKEHIDATR